MLETQLLWSWVLLYRVFTLPFQMEGLRGGGASSWCHAPFEAFCTWLSQCLPPFHQMFNVFPESKRKSGMAASELPYGRSSVITPGRISKMAEASKLMCTILLPTFRLVSLSCPPFPTAALHFCSLQLRRTREMKGRIWGLHCVCPCYCGTVQVWQDFF